MVQTFDQPSSFRCVVAYSYPWASCIQAFFLRYPNPLATHVLSVDVLDRKVEQRTKNDMPKPVLCTTRLILKQGSLPSWAPKGIIKNTQSWVLEESEVDLSAQDKDSPRTMSIWTQNLDHTTVMTVTERMRFTETPKDTICHTRGDIRSFVSLAVLRWRIEKFGFKRYIAHHATAREGLTWAIQHLPQILRRDINTDALRLPKTLSKRQRLLHALRPPFLDGYPLGPFQWLKKKWRQLRGKETPLLND